MIFLVLIPWEAYYPEDTSACFHLQVSAANTTTFHSLSN